MPDMPVFLDPDSHVLLPLEQTDQVAWSSSPQPFRKAVAGGSGA